MTEIQSFAPIAAPDARCLILGSIPGKASLAAGEYYAHPRNLFWRIIAELLQCEPFPDYVSKTRALLEARIALWDVMASCYRPGSLDAAIDKNTIVANDFKAFFACQPLIEQVFFNGATAEQAFRRQVLPQLADYALTLHRLPSTSPAHAAMSYAQKRDCWRAIFKHLS